MSRVCTLCAEQRDMVGIFGEEADPDIDQAIDHWHDRRHPDPGPFLATAGWESAAKARDYVEAAELEVHPGEIVCTACFLVHRPGRCDR